MDGQGEKETSKKRLGDGSRRSTHTHDQSNRWLVERRARRQTPTQTTGEKHRRLFSIKTSRNQTKFGQGCRWQSTWRTHREEVSNFSLVISKQTNKSIIEWEGQDNMHARLDWWRWWKLTKHNSDTNQTDKGENEMKSNAFVCECWSVGTRY